MKMQNQKLTPSECKLGGRSHGVALVEDDQFHTSAHQLLGTAKTLNLVSDHIDTPVVTGIQLESHMLVVFRSVDFFGDRQHAGGLTGPWRSVKQ